jgi:hypothetical protein
MLTLLKLTATGILVAASLIAAIWRGGAIAWWVFAALVLSWFGDAAMAYWKPLVKLLRSTDIFGIGAFGLAHIAYSTALIIRLRQVSAASLSIVLTLTLFELVGIVTWFALSGMSSFDWKIKTATFFYMLLLLGTASLSVSAAKTDIHRLWPVMVGGLLFVISDGLIAVNWLMQVRTTAIPYLIWATYIPAQIFLLIGFQLMPVLQKAYETGLAL